MAEDSPKHADCILQLHLDFHNDHGRFAFDDENGIRSRVWRIGKPPRYDWDTHSWLNWGTVVPPGDCSASSKIEGRFCIDSENPLFLHGLLPNDRIYILVVASNLPNNYQIKLVAIFSQYDKDSEMDGHCGSPFMSADGKSHQAFFETQLQTRPDITSLDERDVKGWYIGWHPEAPELDLIVRSSFSQMNSFAFSLVARIVATVDETNVTRDFSFDPQLDVGGGDGGR